VPSEVPTTNCNGLHVHQQHMSNTWCTYARMHHACTTKTLAHRLQVTLVHASTHTCAVSHTHTPLQVPYMPPPDAFTGCLQHTALLSPPHLSSPAGMNSRATTAVLLAALAPAAAAAAAAVRLHCCTPLVGEAHLHIVRGKGTIQPFVGKGGVTVHAAWLYKSMNPDGCNQHSEDVMG
jgi:hypothetical protein